MEIAPLLRVSHKQSDHNILLPETPRNYVVILASGPEDGGKRATLAFSVACSAAAMDMVPHVFLIGDGSYWAYQGHTDTIHSPGFPPLEELVNSYLELEGSLYVCSACDSVCAMPHVNGSLPSKRPGVQVRGLPSVLQHMVNGSSVTF